MNKASQNNVLSHHCRAYSSYIFTSSVHDNRTVDEITFDRDVKKFIAKYQKCMVNHTMDFCVLGQSYGQNLTEQEKVGASTPAWQQNNHYHLSQLSYLHVPCFDQSSHF